MRRLYSVFALGASSAMVVMACGSTSESSQADDPESPGRMTVLGGEPPEAQREPANGLPAEALQPTAFDASASLRAMLWKRTLKEVQDIADDPGDGGAAATALKTDATKALMRYIVSCALTDTQAIKYDAHDGNAPIVWSGGLGLCPGWESTSDLPCRDTVSSCVVARTNAIAAHVPISIRGQAGFPLPLRKEIFIQRNYREKFNIYDETGIPIKSFEDCSASEPTGDVKRSCGWKPLYVGQCKAGSKVRFTTPDAYCASETPVMLRACTGIYGCQSGAVDPEHPYSEVLADGAKACSNGKGSTVSFECKPNGPLVGGARMGYFSLMMAPQDPTQDIKATAVPLDAETDAPASTLSYPANEKEVFRYPEGGFYGDLSYNASPSEKKRRGERSSLHGRMYACYSGIWANGAAALAERFCAQPNPPSMQCFQYAPGACFNSAGDRCGTGETVPGVSYDDCKEPQPTALTWKEPITVFLNTPCALSKHDGRESGCVVKLEPR